MRLPSLQTGLSRASAPSGSPAALQHLGAPAAPRPVDPAASLQRRPPDRGAPGEPAPSRALPRQCASLPGPTAPLPCPRGRQGERRRRGPQPAAPAACPRCRPIWPPSALAFAQARLPWLAGRERTPATKRRPGPCLPLAVSRPAAHAVTADRVEPCLDSERQPRRPPAPESPREQHRHAARRWGRRGGGVVRGPRPWGALQAGFSRASAAHVVQCKSRGA